MKEFLQPEEEKIENKEKKSVWRTMRNMKNALAFTALLAFAAPAISSSGEKEAQPEKPKVSDVEKEKGIEKAKEDVLKISESLKIKGREGKFGQTTVRRWISENKETVVAGYENDGKPRWLILENEGAKMRFFDMSADGSVNRVILNNSRDPAQRKAAWNDQNTFKSMDNLAKEAQVGADLMPEEVNVYEIIKEAGAIYLRGVDFKTGESEKVVGDGAANLATRVQNLFNQKVAQHNAELAK